MKHQLDDFIKGKFEDRTFEFNDSYWANAEALIVADEKKKRRNKVFFYLSGIALVVLISLGSYYLGTQKAQTTVKQEVAETQIKSNNSKSNNTTKSIANTINNPNTDNTHAAHSGTDFTQPGLIAAERKVTDNTPTIEQDQDFETPDKIVQVGEAIPQNVIESKKTITPITSTIAERDLQEQKQIVGNNIVSAIANSNTKSIGKESPDLNVSNIAMASQKPRVKEDLSNIQKLSMASLMPLDIELAEFSADGLLRTSEFSNDLSSSYNSVPKFYMGLKAGALLYLPAKKVGYNGGFFLGYKLNRNLSLEAELFYSVLRNKYNTVDETSLTTYSFGREDSNYNITPEEIHAVELPLLLNYSFGSMANKDFRTADRFLRHHLNFGASATFVNGIKGNLLQQIDNNEIADPVSGWLNSDYYNKLNYNLLFGYDYALTKAIKIGLRAKYQLNDLYNNEVIQLQSAEPDHLYFELQTKFSIF